MFRITRKYDSGKKKYDYIREILDNEDVKITQIHSSVTNEFKPTGYFIIWNGEDAEVWFKEIFLGKTKDVYCAKIKIKSHIKKGLIA